MRRIVTAVGSAVAAVALSLLVSTLPAHAATGTLRVGFQTYVNPSGCYNSYIWPLFIENNTDETATVYDAADCAGSQIGEVEPGESAVFEFGASVSIP